MRHKSDLDVNLTGLRPFRSLRFHEIIKTDASAVNTEVQTGVGQQCDLIPENQDSN